MSIYDFSILKNNGTTESLDKYRGKVLLIVNSATECGFTPQYTDLKNLHDKYAQKGLVILDFPCNQFGAQAPGTDEEINLICVGKYLLPYVMASKVEVNGDNAHPLFTYLKEHKGFSGFNPEHKLTKVLHEMLAKNDEKYHEKSDIKWNFTKFLVDREGNVIERFEPVDDLKVVEEAIIKLL